MMSAVVARMYPFFLTRLPFLFFLPEPTTHHFLRNKPAAFSGTEILLLPEED